MSPNPPRWSGDRPSRDIVKAVVEVDARESPEEQAERLRAERDELREQLKRQTLNQLKQAQTRSLSPPPSSSMPAIRVEREETPSAPSMRPKTDWILSVLKLAGPKAWIVMIVALVLWRLPEIMALYKQIQGVDYAAEVQALRRELGELKSANKALEAAGERRDKNELRWRSYVAQVLLRLGVRVRMPDGIPPQRQLEFEVPNRQPGQVKGGPSLIVIDTVPLPGADP